MIQYKTPNIYKKFYPSLVWEKQSTTEIFLTFDDGPHPEITPWVLEELEKYSAKATFFCIGDSLKKYQGVGVGIRNFGHKLANHTQGHENGWKIDKKDYLESVTACNTLISEIEERQNNLFRPPYGRIRREQIKALTSDYEIVMWSHLAWDFRKNLDISKSIQSLKNAVPGSIIVFHDNEKSFNNLKRILPEVLPYWSSLGYKFNTL